MAADAAITDVARMVRNKMKVTWSNIVLFILSKNLYFPFKRLIKRPSMKSNPIPIMIAPIISFD